MSKYYGGQDPPPYPVGTVGTLACMFLINAAMLGTYFAVLVAVCAFGYALVNMILHLFGMYHLVTIIDLPFWDLIVTSVGTVCLMLATAVMAYSSIQWPLYRIAWGVSAAFALLATVAFACDAIAQGRERRKQSQTTFDRPPTSYERTADPTPNDTLDMRMPSQHNEYASQYTPAAYGTPPLPPHQARGIAV